MKFKFTFKYSDESIKVEYFNSIQAGIIFANNEGDHLWSYTYVEVPA